MISPIEEIKNRLDIVEVIGSYIKLQKTGANFRTLCPFHSEKKPSFFVSPARQIWHCFGCGLGGDIFKFVMTIEGIEFGDALRILAQKAGVELKPISQELKTERTRLYEINELATRFFSTQLEKSSWGREAKKYLLQRGISENSIRKWRLGYAPESWQGLFNFLVAKGFKGEEIEKAGLAIKNEQSSFYDRFRARIIFPIFDLNSQVIGFAGRIFKEKDKEEVAKYINSPDTLLYDKSRVLYGLDKAKLEMRKKDSCILVEGYTDVILAHQIGTENVVASSGTALTPYQLKIIKRYTENLILGFDMDVAGNTATKRGIDLAQSLGFNMKIVLLPKDLDPADLIFQSPNIWQELLAKAKPILDFYFETTFANFDPKTLEGKKAISKILLPVIKRITNEIERSFWIQELSKRLEVKEEVVVEELKKIKFDQEAQLEDEIEERGLLTKSRKELLEERLAVLILKSPENLKEISKEDLEFFSPKMKEVFSFWKEISPAERAKLPEELIDFLNYLFLKAEVEPIEVDYLIEFKNCLRELKFLEIKKRLNQLSQEIKKAEEERDFERAEKLIQEFNSYSKFLSSFQTS